MAVDDWVRRRGERARYFAWWLAQMLTMGAGIAVGQAVPDRAVPGYVTVVLACVMAVRWGLEERWTFTETSGWTRADTAVMSLFAAEGVVGLVLLAVEL